MPWILTISRRSFTSESRIGRTIPCGICVKMALSQVCLRACRFCRQYHFTPRIPTHSRTISVRLSYVKTNKTSSVSNSTPHSLSLSSSKLRTGSVVSSAFLFCIKLARTGTRDRAALACERSEQLKQISRRIKHPLW